MIDLTEMAPRLKNIECNHEKFSFFGFASLVGNYYCDKCGLKMSPKELKEFEKSKYGKTN